MNLTEDGVGVEQMDEYRILASLLEMRNAKGLNANRSLSQQIIENGDVVRGEVPCNVHIFAHEAEMRPRGGQIINATQLTGVDDLFHLSNARVVKKGVADEYHALLFVRQLDDCLRVFGRQRH